MSHLGVRPLRTNQAEKYPLPQALPKLTLASSNTMHKQATRTSAARMVKQGRGTDVTPLSSLPLKQHRCTQQI